ncbi:MAG TPA: DUF2169 domain-containing protein, partial [Enhygromyxa sp.]|nr:DUF2169 domain-containing protein [Enhygromyxa sp.]
MELINTTPYQAQLFRTVIDDEHILAVLVVKATFNYDREGLVTLERDNPLPIYREYLVTDFGQLWPESFAQRFMAEAFVLGRAMTPELRPATQLDVGLRVGELDVTARVFGRRRWQMRWLRGPQIGAPDSFETMLLDWSHAFGGRALVDGRKVPNLDNPLGRGYVLDIKQIDGVELPNLEEPDRLIRRWSDQPRPFAFSPLTPGSALVDVEDRHNPTPPEASMSGPWATGSSTLNFAHPLLRLDALRDGAAVVMDGMSPDGRRGFWLSTPHVFALVKGRKGTTRLYCKPDTLYIYPQHGRYAVTARKAFRYRTHDEATHAVRLV